jgi:hypothetical protein
MFATSFCLAHHVFLLFDNIFFSNFLTLLGFFSSSFFFHYIIMVSYSAPPESTTQSISNQSHALFNTTVYRP